MEGRTKHRILGVLVIIGLVIILLPFFQSNKELKTETAMIKTPPFPEQVSVASETDNVPPVMNNLNVSKSTEGEIKPQPNDILSVARPNIVNAKQVKELNLPFTPIINSANNKVLKENKADAFEKKSLRLTKFDQGKVKSRITQTIAKPLASLPLKSSLDDKGLVKLKTAVWVIQIGSFKNKANALRLVNQLRANGYRAFIQQATTAALGENTTRVYVGPEHKKASARALASRLQGEMHIKGIVKSYKPLTL